MEEEKKIDRKDLVQRIRTLAIDCNIDIGKTLADFLNEEAQVLYLERHKHVDNKGDLNYFERELSPEITLRTLKKYEVRLKLRYIGETNGE